MGTEIYLPLILLQFDFKFFLELLTWISLFSLCFFIVKLGSIQRKNSEWISFLLHAQFFFSYYTGWLLFRYWTWFDKITINTDCTSLTNIQIGLGITNTYTQNMHRQMNRLIVFEKWEASCFAYRWMCEKELAKMKFYHMNGIKSNRIFARHFLVAMICILSKNSMFSFSQIQTK